MSGASTHSHRTQVAAAVAESGLRRPSFLVIGAQKCGTTWLAHMLRQHPDVHVPKAKELHYFDLAENYERGLDWYLRQFDGRGDATAVGEATPDYLWIREHWPELPAGVQIPHVPDETVLPDSPRRVHEVLPDAKLIVALRDPVERAASAHYHHVRYGPISPWSPMLSVSGRFGILSMGFYHAHLTRWLEHYDRDQVLVLIYEDEIAENKEATLRRVFEFLDVDPSFHPAGTERLYNERPSNALLVARHYAPQLAPRVFNRLPVLNSIPVPVRKVRPEERRTLERIYRADSLALQELLGRPLPWSTVG